MTKVGFVRIAFLVAVAFAEFACLPVSDKVSGEIEEGKYPVIDTGLEQSLLYGPGVLGVWLDDRRIAINALQDAPNARKDWLLRLVVFDTKTHEMKQIAEAVHLNCRDSRTQIASIVEGQGDVRRFIDRKARFVKMDDEGRMSPLAEQPSTMDEFCRHNSPRKPDRLQMFLKSGDGYIDRGPTGKGSSRDSAILYRADGTAVELPLEGGDVRIARYVPHLNQYQLGAGADKRTGQMVFTLMTPEGKINEIPQPMDALRKIIGNDRGASGGPGGWIMRDGLISVSTGQGRKSRGIFFIKGERVIRIFGADGQLVDRLLPSPDGCTLAFLSFKSNDFAESKTVKLINLCGEK